MTLFMGDQQLDSIYLLTKGVYCTYLMHFGALLALLLWCKYHKCYCEHTQMCADNKPCMYTRRAKLGQIQGGGVAEGQLRFDKGGGGVAIFFYYLRVKNITFLSFYAKRLKKAYF